MIIRTKSYRAQVSSIIAFSPIFLLFSGTMHAMLGRSFSYCALRLPSEKDHGAALALSQFMVLTQLTTFCQLCCRVVVPSKGSVPVRCTRLRFLYLGLCQRVACSCLPPGTFQALSLILSKFEFYAFLSVPKFPKTLRLSIFT